MDDVKRVTIFVSHGDEDHYKYLPTVFDDINRIARVIIAGEPKRYAASDKIEKWMKTLANNNKLYAINKFKECIGTCNEKLHIVNFQPGLTNKDDEWIAVDGMTTLKGMEICGNTADIGFDIIAANVGIKNVGIKNVVKNQESIVL